jgi:hypothetical protein
MIKTSFIYFLTFLFCIAHVAIAHIDKVHKEKANAIVNRIAVAKPLPPGMHFERTENSLPHRKIITYKTVRTVSSLSIDSVIMSVMADNLLMDLEFNEDWYANGILTKGFHYNIQDGEINWAYNYGPSVKNKSEASANLAIKSFEVNDEDESSLIIDRKDTLWHYSKTELEANELRHNKAALVYEPMLKKSIDELYELLFK